MSGCSQGDIDAHHAIGERSLLSLTLAFRVPGGKVLFRETSTHRRTTRAGREVFWCRRNRALHAGDLLFHFVPIR